MSGETEVKSGFACIVGRPNVGKSTLLNSLVGSKVAITTPKPQTTRNAIRGIVDRPDAQIVFIDTPGLHKPKTLLGKTLNQVVRRTWSEVDVIVFLLDASEQIGSGDRFIAEELKGLSTPVVAVVNKADRVLPPQLLSQMEAARVLGDWVDVLSTSAKNGTGTSDVVDAIVARVPLGPRYYPEGTLSDQPETTLIAELIREKAIDLTKHEVPHSIAVVIEEVVHREDKPIIEVYASIFVERQSQKGIVIGAGGKMLKQIGMRARPQIEAILGTQVHLDLRVKVAAEWQRDERALTRFGYTGG